ncbi:hypothetical protein [Parasitella parasitica]|uniref:Uncharacterized protein n=1 Tax=Parasitella parasitica TaxID=35722 RepID=A0A0B7NBJ9_9FUNG|nr:hypothetical protein [Parasitella parasitica]
MPDPGWSPRWYLDFPLCCVLSPVSPSSNSINPASIHPKYLLSDICTWQPDLGIVDGVTRRENIPRVLARVDHAIRPSLNSLPATLVFPDPIASSIVLSYSKYYSMPHADVAESCLPDCSHWTISNSSRSSYF